jgi:hypothetical protein
MTWAITFDKKLANCYQNCYQFRKCSWIQELRRLRGSQARLSGVILRLSGGIKPLSKPFDRVGYQGPISLSGQADNGWKAEMVKGEDIAPGEF